MNSLVTVSASWANVQARVQSPRPLSPRWAKNHAKVLQDIYWRMRLVNLAGVLADGTTWSVCVPSAEKKLAHVDWWDKRWVQFNFSSPVASSFMVYARCARAYLDDIEKTYKSQINSYNDELKRLGFELADPGDPGAFLVRAWHQNDKAEGSDHSSPQ